MYPLQCAGGFPLPIKAGKLEIYGVSAVVSDTTAASRLTLIDDRNLPEGAVVGRVLGSDYDDDKGIIDIKGIASADGVLEQIFPEPLKLRHGLSSVNSSNLVAGTIKVYVR